MTDTLPRRTEALPSADDDHSRAQGARAGQALGYRPHLDGLRAVAVYLVVAFHAGIDRASGGFVGVDVFFVLSGYLVTEVLLRDLNPGGGLRLARFYARRIRRLLPAAIVTLIVVGIAYAAIASPVDVLDARRAFQSALLYVSNWYFINQSTDYFAGDINASPVLHFWSLSVEEQFYFAWPLTLWALTAISRRFRHPARITRTLVVLAAALSCIAALRLAVDSPQLAYYGTFTRAYQLLAGALLALTPSLLGRITRTRPLAAAMPALAVIAFAALIILATSLVDVGPITRGTLVVLATATLITAIETADRSSIRRALSLPPLTYLGRISYGTYLWHWPIIVIAALLLPLAPISMFCVVTLLATGLASLSYHLLEQPIRVTKVLDRYRVPVVVAGLALSAIVAVAIVPNVLDPTANSGTARAQTATAAGGTPVPGGLDFAAERDDVADRPDCLRAAPSKCTIVHGTGAHILLLGDSHAQMFIPAMRAVAEQNDLTLSTAVFPMCDWLDGLDPVIGTKVCHEHQQDWFNRVVPALKPDVVMLAQRDPTQPGYALVDDGDLLRADAPGYDKTVLDAASRSIDRLRATGAKVLVVEPVPLMYPFDPLACTAKAKFLEECRFVTSANPTPFEEGLQTFADTTDVQIIDTDPWVCPYKPICDPVVDGMLVWRDSASHITGEYAVSLAPRIAKVLEESGAISSPSN